MVSFFHSLHLYSPRKFGTSSFISFSQNGRRKGFSYFGMNTRLFSSLGNDPSWSCSVDCRLRTFDVSCDEADNGKAKEKEDALRVALTQLSSDFGKESMLSLQRFFRSRRAPVISTGSMKLDVALGIGGLPKGRMVEIYGQEASGKTTLALHVIKEAQKLGGYCAYLDVENAMDISLTESMGINTEKLLVAPPDSAENLLSVIDTLTRSGSVDVIVVDSVAAFLPQHEIDTSIGGACEDLQSRIITKALRQIHSSLSQSQTLILFLNQVRSSIQSGQDFGRAVEVTCGGNALKFYSAVRLKMTRKELLKTQNEVRSEMDCYANPFDITWMRGMHLEMQESCMLIGRFVDEMQLKFSSAKITGLKVRVQVVKNKLAPAMKDTELGIHFGRGFSCEAEVIELACEHGIIFKEGSNYIIEGEVLRGKHAAEQHLSKNDAVLENVIMTLRNYLFETNKHFERV